MAGTRLGIWPG